MALVMVIRCENKITLVSQALIQKIRLPSLVFVLCVALHCAFAPFA